MRDSNFTGSEIPRLLPMLAGGVGMPGNSSDYLFEPKWDGVRALAAVNAGDITLTNRKGHEMTSSYPELGALALAMNARSPVIESVLFDGEIVSFELGGRPSFQRLQRRMHDRQPSARLMQEVPIVYVIFDVLYLDGERLVDLPQAERRSKLDDLRLGGMAWNTSPVLPHPPRKDEMQACRELRLEGFVGKRLDARYQPGRRSSAWTKIKCIRRREFLVGAWLPGNEPGQRSIRSLAIGCYESRVQPSPLRYVGQVGSGLSEEMTGLFSEVFQQIAQRENPFSETINLPLKFVKPTLIVEIAYRDVTDSQILRAPTFEGLRLDLDPLEVVIDRELSK